MRFGEWVVVLWSGTVMCVLVLVILWVARDLLAERQKARAVEEARDLEDAEVAYLDRIWEMS